MSDEGRITPVILCGGGGTRLWPRSRPECPKPFLPLLGEETLFMQTIRRCSDNSVFAPPLIVAGAEHVGLIREQLPDGIDATIILEPAARNTAPAIALAARHLGDEAVMLVCPSDHFIAVESAFVDAAKRAAELARHGWLTAFGIRPTAPETGYGYIKRGKPMGTKASRIDAFVEKPNAARASHFLKDGGYVWNGGIFCFGAAQLLTELAQYRPGMVSAVDASISGAQEDGDLLRPASGPFEAIRGESIDYALMENSSQGAMVHVDMGWSDIGNWAAVADRLASDADGNHADGADLLDCRNVFVLSDGPHVSVVGLEDVVVIVDGDEILISARDEAQNVGQLPGVKRDRRG